jgi:quercetin dioxygenase-like cupin family protein
MSNDQVAPETKGVTVKLLATVDLGPEIEGMAGRQLRMRMVTIEPGGVFGPIHDHKDRPGIVYILQGTITDHRNGVATDYGPGVGWPEDRNTTHWLDAPGPGRSRRVTASASVGRTSPDSNANTTVCVRSRSPSLDSTWATWLLIVASRSTELCRDLGVR